MGAVRRARPWRPARSATARRPLSLARMSPRSLLYSRELPGGGFVAIDVLPHADAPHARLWVERRADPTRRAGHHPPVILELEASDLDGALGALRAVAADNVALAQALRRWAAERRRA